MLRRRPTALHKPASRPLSALSPAAVCLLLALGAAPAAHAGLFDDEEARRQISDLTTRTSDRLDTTAKAQFELANQIQALREDNARLHGQLETLSYELESAKKRQQDFYIDLDARLRKLEPQASGDNAAVEAKTAEPRANEAKPGETKAAVADPAAEAREYEAALNLFKAKKLKDAAGAFAAFVKTHPDSSLAPNAQYWFGNAQYAQGDCKKAIDAHNALVARWPQHAKAADALLSIGSCQQELGDGRAAKKTLETLVAKYPDSPAAGTARQRLKK